MRDKLIKWTLWGIFAALLLWSFDFGMKKQHEIDCANGRYCGV